MTRKKPTTGSVLSDEDIGRAFGIDLRVEPFNKSLIRPSSIKLRLGNIFKVMKKKTTIDTRKASTDAWFEQIKLSYGKRFVLPPKTFVLASSLEKIWLSKRLTGILNTDSSLARIGLNTHGSSGLVPGGYGEKSGFHLTFEFYSYGTASIVLYVGMPVCHLTLIRNITPSKVGYEKGKRSHSGLPTETTNF